MSNQPESLAAALAILQTKLPQIRKSERADVQTAKGSYSYTYADLSTVSAQILPLLGQLGLSFLAKPTHIDGKFVLAYSLLHTSGQRENGEYPLPTQGTPQAIGSAITYGRRYCLCAVTGIAPDDDDDAAAAQAETVAGRTAQRTTAARKPRPPLPTAQRANATDGPPLPTDTPTQTAMITPAQQRKLHALLREKNKVDRDVALVWISGVIDRELASTKDLTELEAGAVISNLETTP